MQTPTLVWDWRPKWFRPPFTLHEEEHNGTFFAVQAVGVDRFPVWYVASIRGATRAQAERLLDLVRIRYETEEFK